MIMIIIMIIIIIMKNDNEEWKMRMIMIMSMILSSIDIEVIRTVYYYYFFLSRYFAQKNAQALFKYLNTLKKHNKEHKQLSFRCKAMNFCSNICLKKYSWHKM